MNDMRRLLEAVLEAIDFPHHPALTADPAACWSHMEQRASLAVIIARASLAENPDDVGWDADYLRARLAELPIPGPVDQDAEASR